MNSAATNTGNLTDRLFTVLDTLHDLSQEWRSRPGPSSVFVSMAYQNAHDWILEALGLTADDYRELTRDTAQAHTAANSSTLNSKALHFK